MAKKSYKKWGFPDWLNLNRKNWIDMYQTIFYILSQMSVGRYTSRQQCMATLPTCRLGDAGKFMENEKSVRIQTW